MIRYDVSDGVCLLRLDAPPLNTIGFAMLDALRSAIGRAREDERVRAIVLAGGEEHFSAGADLSLFDQIRTADEALRLSRTFQEAFQGVEDSAKPVAAALAGNVMGGALELAMACHYRVAAEGSRFSMPEVKLGFNPGAGGTQRLPRLVGLRAGLRMLLTGEAIDARQALGLGLIDAVCPRGADCQSAKKEGRLATCPTAGLIDRAREILQGAAPRKTSSRVDKTQDAEALAAAIREAEGIVAQGRPEILAPRKIIEAVQTGLKESFQAGLRCERESFAACMETAAAKNKVYLFFATRQTSKVPELADIEPARVEKVGVVGMGTMGAGIAQALLLSGLTAVVLDEQAPAVERAAVRIRAGVERRVKDGKLSPQRAEAILSRLVPAERWDDLAAADLVIEAVFEDPAVKHAVLGRLEAVVGGGTVIASNTSTMSLDTLAASLRLPERLVGMHFFNPAHRMPLVEVIRGRASSPQALATTLQLARALKKTPVLLRNREGFVVSRIFIPYVKEAFWLWEEGAEPAAIDRAMVEFGFPMGPLATIDMTGIDILALTDRVLRGAFRHHGELPEIAARLVASGSLGQKSGRGVYRYEPGSYTACSNPSAEELVAAIRREQGRQPRSISPDEITERLVSRMVHEAFLIVEAGIAQKPADLDVAVVLGIGFPDFRGGVLRYAEELGYRHVLEQLEKLSARCGERFAPGELLRHKGA